ncbi:MAG: hypothetical protein HGB10_09915 [Coriobacteriia bacterium]|nr:hypothetical protein [Coriobacteriia bacterium]
MVRTSRTALAALLIALAAASSLLGGCAMFKKAPILTNEQLMAGVIGKEHPVSQEKATSMSCSCHTEAAAKAGK